MMTELEQEEARTLFEEVDLPWKQEAVPFLRTLPVVTVRCTGTVDCHFLPGRAGSWRVSSMLLVRQECLSEAASTFPQ